MYVHGWVPVQAKAGQALDVAVPLRRGVTIQGRVLDPSGKPVAEATMFTRLALVLYFHFDRYFPVPSHAGRFELRGLDPEQTYDVIFLDAHSKLGTVAALSGKAAGGEPVTVCLAPCGAAT